MCDAVTNLNSRFLDVRNNYRSIDVLSPTRGKTAGRVVGLAARVINGMPTLIALHEEGILRLWDLVHHTRLMQHAISPADLPGKYTVVLSQCIVLIGSGGGGHLVSLGNVLPSRMHRLLATDDVG